MSYSEQLRSVHWQKLRLETLQDADWACEACQAKDRQLQVHHKRYVKGRMAWEYQRFELAVLCDQCHEDAHETRRRMMRLVCCVESFPLAGVTESDLIGLCASFMLGSAVSDHDEFLMHVQDGTDRIRLIGHVAAQLRSSRLSLLGLSQFPLLLDGEWIERLVGLINEAQKALDDQIAKDLGTDA